MSLTSFCEALVTNFDGGVLGHTEICLSQRAQSYAEGAKFFRGLRVNFLNNSVKFCGFCVPQQKYVSRRGCRVTQRVQSFLGDCV